MKTKEEIVNSIKVVEEQKIKSVELIPADKYPNNRREHISVWIETGAGDMQVCVYDDNSILFGGHNGFCYPHVRNIEELNKELPSLPHSYEERHDMMIGIAGNIGIK